MDESASSSASGKATTEEIAPTQEADLKDKQVTF
jgi:hypothetical protein